MVYIKRSFLFVSLSLFLLSGMVVSTDLSDNIINLLIFIPGLSILLFLFIEKKFSVKLFFHSTDILYSLFIVFGLFSALINTDLLNFLAVLKLLFYYLVLVTSQKNLPQFINYKLFSRSFILTSSLVFLMCFIVVPPSLNSSFYSGIFSNSNNFGVFSAASLVIIFGTLISRLKYNSNFGLKELSLVFLIFIAFIGVVISSSRTAFVGVIIALMGIFFGLFNFKSIKLSQKVIKQIVIFSLLVLLIIAIIRFTPIYDIIVRNIIQKFIDSIQADNLTTDRNIIWQRYIENAKLFGAESNYMVLATNATAHSSYLEQIGRFGWLAGSMYVGFWFYNLIYNFKLFKKNSKLYPEMYISLGVIFLFVSMSFVESLTHVVPMYVGLFAVGNSVLIGKKSKNDTNMLGNSYINKLFLV